MEINIKTHDDFRRDHVVITLAGTSAEVRAVGERMTGGRAEQLYPAAEVGALQASEAELVAAPLRERVGELEKENQRLARQVWEFDRDRHTEQRRADTAQRRVAELEDALARSIGRENKLESDAAEEAELHRQSIAARDSLLQGAAATVRRVQNVVWTADFDRLAENRGVPAVVHELADLSAAAISRVRAFVGQP